MYPSRKRGTRTVLWSDEKCVVALAPRRYRDQYVRGGEEVGGPYVQIIPPYAGAQTTPVYLHGPTVSLVKRTLEKRRTVHCTVEIAQTVYDDGSRCVSVDYRMVEELTPATHSFELHTLAEISQEGCQGFASRPISVGDLMVLTTPK